MVKKVCILFILALFAALNLHAGTLTATVDRTHIHSDETLALTIQYDESTGDEPDTSALEQQFSIVSRNQASSIQLVNGSASGTTTWYFELMPRKTGTLLIPTFKIEGNFSDAITIEVSKTDPRGGLNSPQDLYTETELDSKNLYVQQQAVITWRLITRLNISNPQFVQPQIDGALVQDLGNRQYQRASSNGDVEHVIEQRYALFPQRSGTLEIPMQQFQVVENFMQRWSRGIIQQAQRQRIAQTEEQQLNVLPADNSQPGDWLPATAMDVAQDFTGLDKQKARVGTSFTRIIRIRAEGLSAEQLPAIDMQADGIKAYSDKPQLSNKATNNGVVGLRLEQAAIIATRAGQLTLPAIHIPWFDVKNRQWRDAVLPETTIEVLPDTSANAKPTPAPIATNAASPASSSPALPDSSPTAQIPTGTNQSSEKSWATRWWQVIAAILLLLLHIAVFYVYRLQRKLKTQTAFPSLGGLTTARQSYGFEKPPVAHSDLQKMHRELQTWAQQNAVNQQALNHPSINPLIQAIEKHLYGNGPAPDTNAVQALPSQLEQLVKAAAPASEKKSQLEDLYR